MHHETVWKKWISRKVLCGGVVWWKHYGFWELFLFWRINCCSEMDPKCIQFHLFAFNLAINLQLNCLFEERVDRLDEKCVDMPTKKYACKSFFTLGYNMLQTHKKIRYSIFFFICHFWIGEKSIEFRVKKPN